MSSISVKWQNANSTVSKYESHRRELSTAAATIRGVKSYRCMRGGNFTEIYRALDRVLTRLENEKNGIKNLSDGLSDILRTYDTYEGKIADAIHSGDMEEKKNPFEWGWNESWNVVSKIGIIGPCISALGRLITGGWTTSSLIKSAKDLLSAIGGVSSTISKGSNANWKEALFGLSDGLKGLDTSSIGETFKSSLAKQFGKDLSFSSATTVGDKIKVATKWGGYALTLFSNVIDNVEEFEGQDGQTGRMLSEIAIETAVDIGVGALATAGVSAAASGLVAAGLITAAPAVAIGVASVFTVWAANGICKWATGGKDIAETVSDAVCDASEWVTEKVGQAAVALKDGFDAITSWGKSLFAFA